MIKTMQFLCGLLRRRWLPFGTLIIFFGAGLFVASAVSDSNSPFKSVEIGIATLSPRGEEGGRAIPASGGSCVTGDTRIQTPQGPRPIEELEAGDSIYSVDEYTGERVIAQIKRMFIHDGVSDPLPDYDTSPLLHVAFDDGSDLRITANHPAFSADEGQWKPLSLFRVGETMFNEAREKKMIVSITELEDEPVVYNLETNHKTHNYFADGTLIHNHKRPPSIPRCQIRASATTINAGDQVTFSWANTPYMFFLSENGQDRGLQNYPSRSRSGSITRTLSAYPTVVVKFNWTRDPNNQNTTICTDSVSITINPPPTKCSNKIDDDGDGLIDEKDPGCHKDGKPPGSSSSGGGGGSGSGGSSSSGGSSGGGTYDPKIDVEEDLDITATPRVVPRNTPTTVTWKATGSPTSCVVTGTNGFSQSGTSGSASSGALTEETFFTLTCTYDGYTRSKTARAAILPTFEEF